LHRILQNTVSHVISIVVWIQSATKPGLGNNPELWTVLGISDRLLWPHLRIPSEWLKQSLAHVMRISPLPRLLVTNFISNLLSAHCRSWSDSSRCCVSHEFNLDLKWVGKKLSGPAKKNLTHLCGKSTWWGVASCHPEVQGLTRYLGVYCFLRWQVIKSSYVVHQFDE